MKSQNYRFFEINHFLLSETICLFPINRSWSMTYDEHVFSILRSGLLTESPNSLSSTKNFTPHIYVTDAIAGVYDKFIKKQCTKTNGIVLICRVALDNIQNYWMHHKNANSNSFFRKKTEVSVRDSEVPLCNETKIRIANVEEKTKYFIGYIVFETKQARVDYIFEYTEKNKLS